MIIISITRNDRDFKIMTIAKQEAHRVRSTTVKQCKRRMGKKEGKKQVSLFPLFLSSFLSRLVHEFFATINYFFSLEIMAVPYDVCKLQNESGDQRGFSKKFVGIGNVERLPACRPTYIHLHLSETDRLN